MGKKLGSTALAALMLFQTANFAPTKAHAIFAPPPVNVVAGVLLMFMGGFGSLLGPLARAFDGHENDDYYAITGIGIGVAVVGLLILEDESGAPSFGPLSEGLVAQAGLTPDEVDAYGLELPELNRALNGAASELAAAGIHSAEEALSHDELWERHSSGLLPETRSAVRKLGAYLGSVHRR